MKLKIGDTVKVIRGKDKGKTGKVIQVFPKTRKLMVEDINKVTKHKKPNTSSQPAGKYVETRAILADKVGLVHPTKKNLTSKIGYKVTTKGKVRIYRTNKKEV